jgi:hypothetical protein
MRHWIVDAVTRLRHQERGAQRALDSLALAERPMQGWPKNVRVCGFGPIHSLVGLWTIITAASEGVPIST